ncbi:hypothetical protein OG429_37635 [Streptomyces sp. NBC_00190]|uniref:hypothetical protein n=1 Tax=unclassified Streptomyces TaxID=2593676 RepID=UPI002E2A9418|nr:hypothetical protein [Streptomyces sp. NBC_00190]WSZ44490.1 hypothetical protein OG239_40110 [Streptomyces sp. NBC_00868]
MTTENCRRDLTAVCKSADSGYLLQVVREGSCEPLAEKDLSHWPDWPIFPFDAAHAAGCELVLLGYMIWPDSVTPDSLIGWRPVPGQQAWSATVGTFAQLQDAGI